MIKRGSGMKIKIIVGALIVGFVLSGCTGGGGLLDNDDRAGLSGDGSFGQNGNFEPDSIEYFRTSIGDSVFFPVDQSSLTQQAQGILDAQATWLKDNARSEILIEGHADEQGTRAYNLALGARRASAVRNYLVSRGVPTDQLQIVSFGKERPLEVCSQESCYSQNRRAVTRVSGDLAG